DGKVGGLIPRFLSQLVPSSRSFDKTLVLRFLQEIPPLNSLMELVLRYSLHKNAGGFTTTYPELYRNALGELQKEVFILWSGFELNKNTHLAATSYSEESIISFI